MIQRTAEYTACAAIGFTALGLVISYGTAIHNDYQNYDADSPFQSTTILTNKIFYGIGNILYNLGSSGANAIVSTYSWLEKTVAPTLYGGIQIAMKDLSLAARDVANMTAELADGTGTRAKSIKSAWSGDDKKNQANTAELNLDENPLLAGNSNNQNQQTVPTQQQPEATTQQPQATTQQPQTTTLQPEATTQQPQATTLQPEATTTQSTNDPKVVTKDTLSKVNEKLKAVIDSKPEYQNAYQVCKDINLVLSPSKKDHIKANEQKISVLSSIKFADSIGLLDSTDLFCSKAPTTDLEQKAFNKNLGLFYSMQRYSKLADKIGFTTAQLSAQESDEIKKLVIEHKLIGGTIGQSIFNDAKKLSAADASSKTVANYSCELVNAIKGNNEITSLYSNVNKEDLSASLVEMCQDSSFGNEPLCATIFDTLF